jgi:hypothetical protein
MVSTIGGADAGGPVRRAIYTAASVTGVDFNYLLNQARVESGLNPAARAGTSSATGLYQFIEQSWLGVVAEHGAAHGLDWAASAIERGSNGRYRVADPAMRAAILDLRADPAASAAMAAELASDNRDHLERRLGHAVETVDLYLAHFLGAGGATRFLRRLEDAPDTPAAALFPAAARANRGVFFDRDGTARSLTEVRARFAAKFDDTLESVGPQAVGAGYPVSIIRPAPEDQAVRNAVPVAQARLAYLMLASLGVSA